MLTFAGGMTARRNKSKSQNRQLHRDLETAEKFAKQLREQRKLSGKKSEVLINLATLVFGGAIIGGIFQENVASVHLYLAAVMAFTILLWWGLYLYKQSIKED